MSKAARLATEVDWTRFFATCRRHRIQGLVWRAIERFDLKPPNEVADLLAADATEIASSGLRAASICARLSDDFAAADIPLLFVKGLTLSTLAYGDPFVKMSHDIDVLVPLADIDRACAALITLGYAQAGSRQRDPARWHKAQMESDWVRHGYPTIDLHTRLAENRRLLPGMSNRSPAQQVEIAPGITLPTLAADELAIYLCVHGASSAWFRLKWIADVAALLDRPGLAGVDQLLVRASQLGAGRAVPAALLLIQRLFDTAYAPAVQQAIATPVNQWLARIGYRELCAEAEPTERRLGTLAIHASQLLLMPGASFKASEVVRQIRSALAGG